MSSSHCFESDFQTNLICSNCYKTSNDQVHLKSCSGCKLVLYCSPQCQKKNWSIHKKTCLLISKKRKENENLKSYKNESILLKIQRPQEEQFKQLLCYNESKSYKEYLDPSYSQFNEIDSLIKQKGKEGLILYFNVWIDEHGKIGKVDLENYREKLNW
eukprot:gene11502-4666_t